MNRKRWMTVIGLLGCLLCFWVGEVFGYEFKLPPLPYEKSALAPVISRETMEFHYGKHLKGYLDNLNSLVPGTPFEGADLPTIVKYATGPIYDNGAQALNHILYFNTFSAEPAHEPTGALAEAIARKWSTFEDFKKAFSEAGVSLFGSGWVWLVKDRNGDLFILQESNAGNPLSKGYTPLLGIDVWEHAYYLDYRNKRADYMENIWKIIDWDTVEARY
ncbi:superoxide dismutase [Odoribacter lunatus]|uniref:superoxide dismutase n=1 Tax=Odoribacter lunatus TaxID=2941335 RepID=UPI002040A484|nr:superoxide dismutase [Odoribacter lunatus]